MNVIRALMACLVSLGAAQASALQIESLDLSSLGEAAEPSVSYDPQAELFVLSWQRRLGDGCVALETATLSAAGELGQVKPVARGCDWFVNWADFPSVTVADNGDWLSFYLQRSEGHYGYAIRLLRSRNQGRSWSEPFSPHPEGTTVQHGFVSMAPIGDEQILIAWLDGRSPDEADQPVVGDEVADQAEAEHHDHTAHQHGEDAMTLRSAVISRNAQVSQPHIVDSRVCSCCATAMLRHNNSHWLVYRDRSLDEIRDIALAQLHGNRWHRSGLIREDGWRITGCPVNGPALAASEKDALVVWPSMGDGEMAVRATTIGSATSAVLLASGRAVQGRVAAAPLAGDWLVSWLGNGEDGELGLQLARLEATSLALSGQWTLDELSLARVSGMPRMASNGRQAVIVWTDVKRTADGSSPMIAARRLSKGD